MMDTDLKATVILDPAQSLTPEILVTRLGDYLVEQGRLTPEHLQAALEKQDALRRQGAAPLLGALLVEMGFISRKDLDQAVTEQILQLRTALEENNRQLESRVEQRTGELQAALNQLTELNQLKSNFIANISHELRTPLTHIKGYIELLLSETMGPFSEQQASSLRVMQRATERLGQQIEDLISFSLAARGELTLRLEPSDPVEMFGLVARNTRVKAANKNIRLLSTLEPDLPYVMADPQKIEWVLLHLVDNAVKFTPPEGSVTLRASRANDQVRLGVVDTGIGIPPDRIEEIFEPFHQLDSSSTRRYGGTGLGLALVQRILSAHGAAISVQSQVGKGSCFEFCLPIA